MKIFNISEIRKIRKGFIVTCLTRYRKYPMEKYKKLCSCWTPRNLEEPGYRTSTRLRRTRVKYMGEDLSSVRKSETSTKPLLQSRSSKPTSFLESVYSNIFKIISKNDFKDVS
ncbi:unnamed protein product [Rhizophagus irregularis]|uniref:Uncharacterized protein n=1 Tax=Rhizophagus irregularis TaxID=588596 RepID=A0A916EEE8_9GLOM|nr:unnamed protein product [Rhizophagus irregularis]CAB5381083.1 unnamed protein product [Rhizophagus irregularis]